MVGLLGMIGVILAVCLPHFRINPYWLLIIAVLLIGALGLRSALRGHDYRSQVTIAYRDIAVSPADYVAYNNLAANLIDQAKFNAAVSYAARSVKSYPTSVSYQNLGVALAGSGDYGAAVKAFDNGLKYGNNQSIYENLAEIALVYGNPAANQQSLIGSLEKFPHDANLWECLAILKYENGNKADAKTDIAKAASYGQIDYSLYKGILNNQPIAINLYTIGKRLTVQ
jgi:tetratricopeptide (TPR) repeat protein